MVNDTRPVWLTREQRDGIKQARIMPWLVDAWDAAPADPAEAIAEALEYGEFPGDHIAISDLAVRALRRSHAPKATP